LTIGILGTGVKDYVKTGRIRTRSNLSTGRKTATPVNIRLENIDRLVVCRPLKGDMGVPVFPRAEGLPRDAFAQGEMSIEILREEALLHPLEPIGT
jgi:hypothetical protein